jgi:hypothetical protein
MPDETLMEIEDESSETIDDAALAGLSEYSATGGGAQPPHFPQIGPIHETIDEPEVPDAASFREMYRYSLGRATQDAHAGEEDSDDGPLHLVARVGAKRLADEMPVGNLHDGIRIFFSRAFR